MRPEKVLEKARRNPGGLRFSELCELAEAFGFTFQRQKGSHRICALDRLKEIMNFQDDSRKAKAYQVRQLLSCADRNQLSIGGGKDD